MPSNKKISREQALRWGRQGGDIPSALSWQGVPSAASLSAAATLVGGVDRARVIVVAEHIDRIVELTASSGARVRNG
jgi:hypothetical protein